MDGAVNLKARRVVDGVLRALWPATCLVCGMAGDARADRDLCPTCVDALPWNRHACRRCALPLAAGDAGMTCGACLGRCSLLQHVEATFAYAAPLDRLVPMFKFHQSLASGRLLSMLMAEALRDAAAEAPRAVLVPIPLHRRRLQQRGYNQALELTRPLARRLGLAMDARLLTRPKQTRAQSLLDRSDRRGNLHGAFLVDTRRAMPAHVVLVDDVMTTGATLEAAASSLLDAGVARVDAWVCARVA